MKRELAGLFGEIDTACESSENQRRERLWKGEARAATELFAPGIAVPYAREDAGFQRVPVTVELERPTWARILGFSMEDYYQDPSTRLRAELEVALYRFEAFADDTPIGRTISLWMGVGFEPSLFGLEPVFSSLEEPWVGRRPIVESERDIATLREPDFFKSGLMPLAHRMYEEIVSAVPGDFSVLFPEWGRGPFGVAVALRGMENILVDCYERPRFVHTLMRFVTDSCKKWSAAKSEFLGCKIGRVPLYNDEASSPIISPGIYEEFIEPYEREIAEFHGGITWWHSCGKKSSFLAAIHRIGSIELVDASLWADDLEEMAANIEPGTSLMVRFHPVRVVDDQRVTPLRELLGSIHGTCKDLPYSVRADGLQFVHGQEEDIARIKRWLNEAMEWAQACSVA